MKKKFNITGICNPHVHYMMDNSAKLDKIMEMVESGEYFTIHRPRQYGKTTTLSFLQNRLENNADYICIALSFEDVEDIAQLSDNAFALMFSIRFGQELALIEGNLNAFWDKLNPKITDFNTLSIGITQLIRHSQKRLVLLIDEVDASSNYESFLKFLAMLRSKYLSRFKRGSETFHSVVLAGVHDVKALKFKMRDPSEHQTNSPWNIAADFKIDMAFSPTEIAPMLVEYSKAENVPMNIPALAQRLHYYTSGYPFLVSKLCKTIAEDILPNRIANSDTIGTEKTWHLDDVEDSVKLLLKENNTNFDSLIKNLENNKDLYDLVYRTIIEGEIIPFNPDNSLIQRGVMYGLFKDNGQVKIHNRLYEQRLYNYMTVNTMIELKSKFNYGNLFTLEDNALDMPAVLLKFQQFMKEEFNEKDKTFLERNGRLVFLSFFAPILNGKGHTFKEVQTSAEKRLDIVTTYFQHKYIVELKRWYGEVYHEKGITLRERA